MAALTNFMKDRTSVKKVYLINQDYSFGQAVRKGALVPRHRGFDRLGLSLQGG